MSLLSVEFLKHEWQFFIDLLRSLFDVFVKVVYDGQEMDVYIFFLDLIEMGGSKSFVDRSSDVENKDDWRCHFAND